MDAASELVVFITAGDAEEAERIAEAVVRERLAACVSITGSVRSIYRWQGAVEKAEESLLIIKTTRGTFDALARRIRELHSYEAPEIIALPVVAGDADYLRWLRENVG